MSSAQPKRDAHKAQAHMRSVITYTKCTILAWEEGNVANPRSPCAIDLIDVPQDITICTDLVEKEANNMITEKTKKVFPAVARPAEVSQGLFCGGRLRLEGVYLYLSRAWTVCWTSSM